MSIRVDSSPGAKQPLYRKGKTVFQIGCGAARLYDMAAFYMKEGAGLDKLDKLAEILKKTDTKVDFDIVGDLEELQRRFGVIKTRDFRKKLAALIEKYKNTEITLIRSALVEKCRKGDTNAIRLYCDYFKPAEAEDNDDGLLEALSAKGQEVFSDDD